MNIVLIMYIVNCVYIISPVICKLYIDYKNEPMANKISWFEKYIYWSVSFSHQSVRKFNFKYN